MKEETKNKKGKLTATAKNVALDSKARSLAQLSSRECCCCWLEEQWHARVKFLLDSFLVKGSRQYAGGRKGRAISNEV